MNELIYVLLVGAISGWLAGKTKQGYGFGLVPNMVLGILGAYVGQWLLRSVLHISLGSSLIDVILTSVLGALVILYAIGIIKKA